MLLKDKERILKEIQEDREKLRMTKQAKVEVPAEKTPTQQAAAAANQPPSQETVKEACSSASIQVRKVKTIGAQ